MKQARVIVVAVAVASGMASASANVSQSKLAHEAPVTKPDVAIAVSANYASRAQTAAAPPRVGRPVASVVQPTATSMRSAATATVPAPQHHQLAPKAVLSLASGVALPMANVSRSHAAHATKPHVVIVVSTNNASRTQTAAAPQRAGRPIADSAVQPAASVSNASRVQSAAAHQRLARPIAARPVRPTAKNPKLTSATVVPSSPQQQQLASKAVSAAVSLSAKMNLHKRMPKPLLPIGEDAYQSTEVRLSAKLSLHKQARKPLLPIGEGAYQSAEAVAQRTMDSDRDCEKGRWNGCLHDDKADIVDGHSYGHLRGAESAASVNADSASSGQGGSASGAGQGAGSAGQGSSSAGQGSGAAGDAPGGASTKNGASGTGSAGKGGSADGDSTTQGSASAGKGGKGSLAEKGSAAGCFNGFALASVLLSLSAAAHS